MSNFPKFILGDNTDMPDAMFVVHLEYRCYAWGWTLILPKYLAIC